MQTYSFATPRLRYFETAFGETTRPPLERLRNYETAFMIKIAFVIDTIESPTAGTEKQLLLLLKHLDRTKFKPYLCVLRSSKWLREEFNLCELIDADILSFKKLSAYRNIYKLSRFFRTEGIDIVQTHFVEGNKVGVIAAKIAGIRTIIGSRRNQGYWMNTKELLIQKILNRCMKSFIANSESTRLWVVAKEGISKDLINVVYNGVDLESIRRVTRESKTAIKLQFGLPPDVPIVGIVANLRPVKGLDVFLKSAKLVMDCLPNLNIVIVGEGCERNKLEELVKKLHIDASVHFFGRCDDVSPVIATFDVGVLSSNSESFSNALVEYLAAGLPVVSTDVGGACEAIQDGINGYVVPVGDSDALASRIFTVLSRDSDAMGVASRNIAEAKFSLAAMTNKFEMIYLSLVRVEQ